MSPRTSVAVALVVVGFLLLTNPLWLFPHEGDTRYTYDRSEIAVENGTLEYAETGVLDFAEENSLNRIECQRYDDEQPRACAFDHYLATHPPVTAPETLRGSIRPDFVEIDGSYYRRIHRQNDSREEDRTVVHDVERVQPETVLAESAIDVPDSTSQRPDDLWLEQRIAITGETETSFEDLDEDGLGRIYRQDGTYYTVVVTGEQHVSHGIDFLRYEVPRYGLALLGLFLAIAGALPLLSADRAE